MNAAERRPSGGNARRARYQWLILCGSAAVTVVALAPVRAQAVFTNRSFVYCRPISNARLAPVAGRDANPSTNPIAFIGADAPSTPYKGKFYCTVEDDSAGVPASLLTTVSMMVEDNSPTDYVYALTCVKFYYGMGGSCGGANTTAPNSNQGSFHLILNTNWPSDAWRGFSYIYVELPALNSPNVPSRINGFSAYQ